MDDRAERAKAAIESVGRAVANAPHLKLRPLTIWHLLRDAVTAAVPDVPIEMPPATEIVDGEGRLRDLLIRSQDGGLSISPQPDVTELRHRAAAALFDAWQALDLAELDADRIGSASVYGERHMRTMRLSPALIEHAIAFTRTVASAIGPGGGE